MSATSQWLPEVQSREAVGMTAYGSDPTRQLTVYRVETDRDDRTLDAGWTKAWGSDNVLSVSAEEKADVRDRTARQLRKVREDLAHVNAALHACGKGLVELGGEILKRSSNSAPADHMPAISEDAEKYTDLSKLIGLLSERESLIQDLRSWQQQAENLNLE